MQAPRVAVVGHVDHGKSTMVGRLLHETGSLPDGRFDAVERVCRERGRAFEYAFLLDALEEERDQGITIDTAQVWLNTPRGTCVLFDAPGHKEFVKNMVCGAASADAAIVLVDAGEGVQEQSRRHGNLLGFLGVSRVVVVVNKMDLAAWSRDRFAEIEREFGAFLRGAGIDAPAFVPVSAREGDNVTRRSERMPWHDGPTVLDAITSLPEAARDAARPLRMAVQDVYKFDDRRIVAGRIESGSLAVGDRVLFTPSNKRGVVRSLERWNVNENPSRAVEGESIGFTLEEQIFVERGEIVSHEQEAPKLSDVFSARVFWMGKRPLVADREYTLKLLTQEVPCRVEAIERVLDATTMRAVEGSFEEVPRNEIGEVVIRTDRPVALDAYGACAPSGRFVLVDGHDVCGGGTVAPLQYPDQRGGGVVSQNITWEPGLVTTRDRAALHGHGGAVVWFTGLSGAGKSTISQRLEQALVRAGAHAYRLDGDNVRHGLNSDLGFSPDDRAENIRRVAEVAKLFADAGLVVLTSFISPYRSERRRARQIAGEHRFLEVFVDCPIEVCEERDPKGLYRKARRGEIAGFTGVSAPYEKPDSAEIYLNTETIVPEDAVEILLQRLREFGVLPATPGAAVRAPAVAR